MNQYKPEAQASGYFPRTVTYSLAIRLCVACLFVSMVSIQSAGAVQLAPQIQIFARQVPALADAKPEDQARAEAEARAEEERSIDLAVLKTDPDLEALMEKAERYRGDGNYRVASTLWQAVLERSGDALYSDDEETYYSMVQRVEKVLAALPPEGLKTYRVTADAEARELLARSGPQDTSALATVVQKYFISSVGDDAALKLASIFLDRFDFSGARRMLEKIANGHPDPSVPMDQVFLKIALCNSWLGDTSAAESMLDRSVESALESEQPRNFELVKSSIGNLSFDSVASEKLDMWKMPLGNESRVGTMPAPPRGTMDGPLVAVWQFYTEPKNSRSDRRDFEGKVRAGREAWGSANLDTRNAVERKLIDAWSEKDWRPAGEILFDEQRIFFRSVADITAWDKQKVDQHVESALSEPPVPKPFKSSVPKGKEVFDRIAKSVSWRSVWRNTFEIDPKTMVMNLQRSRYGGYGNRNRKKDSPVPATLPEIQFFGDKIAASMSIHQETLYAVEGGRFDLKNRHPTRRLGHVRSRSVRRLRNNFLTAYDRTTGQAQWSLPEVKVKGGEDEEAMTVEEIESEEYISSGGFMAAPIGYGNLIIVPVNIGGTIYAYALDPANGGKTVWKSFLCDEAETSANAWSPIEMSINGSDLFVSCGMGVVFSIDAASGVVRFARRYERDGRSNPFGRGRSFNSPKYKFFEGWSSDVIIPWNDQIICFSSDRNTIEAYDRDRGELLWKCDSNPMSDGEVDYVIGVYNDILYVGGFKTVIAFQLKREGAILWGGREMFGDQKSRGKAMLTADGVFVPVEDSIIQYALEGDGNGRADEIGAVKVDLGTGAPVGNLYSDGQRIWVHGANRLYALQPDPENE
jgi:outer membrane protein assembly factor BamB